MLQPEPCILNYRLCFLPNISSEHQHHSEKLFSLNHHFVLSHHPCSKPTKLNSNYKLKSFNWPVKSHTIPLKHRIKARTVKPTIRFPYNLVEEKNSSIFLHFLSSQTRKKKTFFFPRKILFNKENRRTWENPSIKRKEIFQLTVKRLREHWSGIDLKSPRTLNLKIYTFFFLIIKMKIRDYWLFFAVKGNWRTN